MFARLIICFPNFCLWQDLKKKMEKKEKEEKEREKVKDRKRNMKRAIIWEKDSYMAQQ